MEILYISKIEPIWRPSNSSCLILSAISSLNCIHHKAYIWVLHIDQLQNLQMFCFATDYEIHLPSSMSSINGIFHVCCVFTWRCVCKRIFIQTEMCQNVQTSVGCAWCVKSMSFSKYFYDYANLTTMAEFLCVAKLSTHKQSSLSNANHLSVLN